MKYVFFIEGGALGIENALKTAFDWKVRRNKAKGIPGEKGSQIVHFREAFHGRTGYTLSLTNTDPVKTDYFPKFKWPRIENPKLRFPVTPEVKRDVIGAEQQALAQLEKAFVDNPDDIAAIIIEPIQAEGGDNHFRPEFLQALQAAAKRHECFFIVDEVQTGVGMTGKMWGHEHFGIQPDALAFGKKRTSSRCPRGSTPPGAAASPTWCASLATWRSSKKTGWWTTRARWGTNCCAGCGRSKGSRAGRCRMPGAAAS
jgi:L-lysine 6-transaminase